MAELHHGCPLCPDEDSSPILRRHPRGYSLLTVDTLDPVPGGWCDLCLLPSVWTMDIVTRCRHGWPSTPIGQLLICDECGMQRQVKPGGGQGSS